VPKLIKCLAIFLPEAETHPISEILFYSLAISVTLYDTENPKCCSPKCNMPISKLYEPELTIIPAISFLGLKILKSSCLLHWQKKMIYETRANLMNTCQESA